METVVGSLDELYLQIISIIHSVSLYLLEVI